MNIEELKYPIGKFSPPEEITKEQRYKYIEDLESLPALMRSAVESLSQQQLDTPYRPDGWTVRQLVHHVPDSHLNSYIRFKWALTESQPVIKAYDEKSWAELNDATGAPVEMSLYLLECIHVRWVWLLKSLTEDDWKKCFTHPETNKLISLDLNLSLYSWHGKHHLAHIINLKERNGWA